MFYTYGLSFERASSLSYSVALTVAHSEALQVGTRRNGVVLTLSAIVRQALSGQPSPWSSDFSSDFGSGLPNQILFSVGKNLRASIGQTGFLLEPPTRFHVNSQAAPATSSQLSHLSLRQLAGPILSVISSQTIALILARPWHTVLAAKTPSIGALQRLTSILLSAGGNPFAPDFAIDFGPPPLQQMASVTFRLVHTYIVQSGESTALLRREGLFRRATAAEATNTVKTIGKTHITARDSQAAATPRTPGKPISAIITEVVALVRMVPSRISLASAETAGLSFGGGNLFARAVAALSGEVAALQRGQAALRGLAEANTARLGRSPGKASPATEAQANSLLKQPGLQRGASDGQAAASKRQPGLVRGVLAQSIQVLQTAGAHFAAAISVAAAQVAALMPLRTFAQPLALLRVQSSSVSLSSVRSLLRSIGVTSAQVGRVARGVSRSAAVLSGATLGLASGIGKVLALASASIASLLSLARHLFIGSVTSPEIVAQRASFSSRRGIASLQTVSVTRRRGVFLAALSADVASLQTRLSTLILTITRQVISLTNTINKAAFSIVWPEVVSALKGVSKTPATTSPEAAASVTRKGSSLGTVSSAQVATLRRLTAKFLLAFSPQALGAGGRGGSKVLRTATTNIAAMFRPRSVAVRTSQGQAATNVVYYHFFVAPWAYQQTSLLPPSGGPAEPPSFGPIDPADQTIFGFDWTSRAYPNDAIMSAVVTCVPPYLPFLAGSLFISGNLVEVTVPPFPEPVLPTIYSLRCTATFASGRVSSFSIPVPVRTL